MATKKITEQEQATVNSDASFLITEKIDDAESLRRARISEVIKALETAGIEAAAVADGCVNENALSDELAEKLANAGGGGLAFDSLVLDDNGYLHIQADGEDVIDPCFIGGSGGGGSDFGSVIRIINGLDSRTFSVMDSAEACNIIYTVTSTDTSDSSPTGNVTAAWYINGTRRSVATVPQGENTFDVLPYLTAGTSNTVKLTIEDSYGNSKSMTWTITVTSYGINWNLDTLSRHGSDDVTLRLTITGTGAKTAIVTIDGAELYRNVITSSGRTQVVNVPAQTHGAHVVEAWLEIAADGETLKTDVLRHTGIWTEAGNTTPIIAVANDTATVAQYGTANISYMIYNPAAETSVVSLAINGKLSTTVTVDRSLQTWSYKAAEMGTTTMSIICGNVRQDIKLEVSGSGYDIHPITTGLVADVDPSGHSNSETSAASFGYTDADGTNHPFTYSDNFDWTNGGFQLDNDGVTAFVIKRGTYVKADKSFFADNAKTNGKEIKIVFKAANVRDYDTEILSCLNGTIGIKLQAQQATLGSELQQTTVQYCEERKIEMDINIDATSENKLAMIWLEGVPSRVFAYSDSDSWVQASPEVLTIGSADCDVWIYRIKEYNMSLSRHDILANYIADCSDTAEMIARYERNDIYTDDGSISIARVAEANRELRTINIMAERMTTSKSDAVTCDVEIMYYAGGEEHHLTARNVEMKAQGTSSLEYILAALNLDLDFSKATEWTNGNGEDITSYAMTSNSVPVSYFNLKLNVASSENANNVCLADDYNTYQPVITPARAADSRIRDTVEGHPCAVFFTNTSSDKITVGARTVAAGETILYGNGDMNNSKKNYAVFGQTSEHPLQCCVEIGNNNNPQCLFKSDDLSAEKFDGDGDFEFRYPKKPTDEMKALFAKMLSWVVSTNTATATNEALDEIQTIGGAIYTTDSAEYRAAKFKNELANYFSVDSLLYHYLFTERHGMVDNRAKNTFVSYEWDTSVGDYRWNFNKDYDNDTADGNDNSGGMTFTYGLEDTDMVGASYVFNANDSVLWCNIRDYMADELQAMYTDRESKGAWSASRIIKKFEDYQSARPEALVTEDMYGKYISPYIYAGAGRYLGMMLGNKTDQRAQYETYQEGYIASKYKGSAVTGDDKMTFRINKPENWQGVKPSGNIVDVVPYANTYLRAKFGNAGEVCIRAERGKKYTLECPSSAQLNDLETYVYRSSNISHMGSMAGLYTKFADVTAATRLQEFILGSNENGYENTGITSDVSVGNNKLLEIMDLRGTPNLAVPLDLSGLTSLKELYATNSGITGVTFATGAPVETVALPEVRRLVAKSLKDLTDFTCGGTEMQSIIVEDCPAIDTLAIVQEAAKLTRGRITGVDWAIEDANLLLQLANLRGFDVSGAETDNFVLVGKCHITMVSEGELETLAAAFPDLKITYESIVDTFTVTFVDWDDTVLNVQRVRQYGAAANPVTSGLIATPTRDPDVEKVYTFTSWDTAYSYILQNTTVKAVYTATDRTYRVTWWANSSKTSKLYELTDVLAHDKAVYAGDTPTAASGALWVGWSEATVEVVADMDIYAEYITPKLPDAKVSEYDYLYSDDSADNAAYTLAEFYGIINSGQAKNYFTTGDKIKLVPDAGTTAFADSSFILQLEAFNHFKLSDGSGDFAACHFGMIGIMNSNRSMNSTSTNVGGWAETSMRKWLNNTIYNALPQKWKAMIKKVQVISTIGNTSDTTSTSDDYLYLRSWREVGFGSSVPYGAEVDENAENKNFPVYTDNASRVKKPYNNTGSAANWWLRSPYASSSNGFANVFTNGSSGSTNANNSYGVSFGFSI